MVYENYWRAKRTDLLPSHERWRKQANLAKLSPEGRLRLEWIIHAELCGNVAKTCPEFFVSLYKNMGLQDNGLKLLVGQIVEASGIKFTIHKLRHTFATLMLDGGCDIYSLSKMMGHSDIKTTTIYLATSVEYLREQIVKHPLD